MKKKMFHVAHSACISFAGIFIMLCFVLLAPFSAFASYDDMEIASHIAKLLGEEFQPEKISVTVQDSRAYAEMRGAVMSDIRIDTMRLDALITNRDQPLQNDVDSLATLIGYSKGELILLEEDVNRYFETNETSGFSNLHFDFSEKGFRAEGVFQFKMLVTLRIRLAATGVLALGSEGVYLDNVNIYAENMKQPDLLTEQVLKSVNPLIEWSRIPFKVEFKDISMNDAAAIMTGYPRPIEGGSTAIWQK